MRRRQKHLSAMQPFELQLAYRALILLQQRANLGEHIALPERHADGGIPRNCLGQGASVPLCSEGNHMSYSLNSLWGGYIGNYYRGY